MGHFWSGGPINCTKNIGFGSKLTGGF